MKKKAPVVALLTDFGLEDNYAGVMKGVMVSMNPRITCIDITHTVEQGDVFKAAFILQQSYRFFPRGTVFLAVVDPTVGSERARLLIETAEYSFVGPDNGLLSCAARENRIRNVYRVEDTSLFCADPCRTFEGRDIFAPLAASRTLGKRILKRLSPMRPDGIVSITFPLPRVESLSDSVETEVIYIDHFGNIILSLQKDDCIRLLQSGYKAEYNGKPIRHFFSYYAEGPDRALFFTEGSFRHVEISAQNKSAAEKLKAKVGDRVFFSRDKR